MKSVMFPVALRTTVAADRLKRTTDALIRIFSVQQPTSQKIIDANNLLQYVVCFIHVLFFHAISKKVRYMCAASSPKD